MKIEIQDGTLAIREIKELGGSDSLCQNIRSRLSAQLQGIEIDLTNTEFMDSGGLGDLIAVHRLVRRRVGQIPIRLVNPSGPVGQYLELTRLHELFEIFNPLTETT